MPSQITLWKTTGDIKEYSPPAVDDKSRGILLVTAINEANPGDAVVVGPGDYLKPTLLDMHPKPNDVTKDGVRLHLVSGARIYDNERSSNVPVVNVTAGTHWLTGHGTIEHKGSGLDSVAAGVFVKQSGTLICEADEIISTTTQNSAVKAVGNGFPDPPAVLYINTRKHRAINYDAIEVGRATCIARIQHAETPGNFDANAIETNTADDRQVRVLEIQRAESNEGITLNLQSSSGVCNILCQSVFGKKATAILSLQPFGYAQIGHVSTESAVPTIRLGPGRIFADEIEQNGDAIAVDIRVQAHLNAHLVLNNFKGQNAIKVSFSFPNQEPIIDVAEIKLQLTAANSVFADAANSKIAMIRNFLSAKPISANSPPIQNNH